MNKELQIETVLEHIGVKRRSGRYKWGSGKNPYQSESGSLGKMTKEQRHEKLLKSTNAKELYKYRKELSDNELQNRINRINMESNLKKLSNTKQKKIDNIIDAILDNGKKANEFYKLMNSELGKAIASKINEQKRNSKK